MQLRFVSLLILLGLTLGSSHALAEDDDATDRCFDACVEAEELCTASCSEGPEGDACAEGCEDQSSDCMDACEADD
jgi:hypothetical protein